MARENDPEEVFNKAMELSDPAEQAAYLDAACGGDEKLRAQVEALLQWHQEAGDFLEVPAVDPNVTLETSAAGEGPGATIGRYKLLERIGEGGMATVYMAEQKHPIRRRVALKIIKLGMDTRQVIARFEAERQALAMMDHPNIAKVLDAGTTKMGRPYFVMELVRGLPITEFCDQNNLTTRERLELFITVCQAVQHAHQRGIIHRDIKPSNIMVTLHDGAPVAKVIDFGIAKAVNQQLTEKTVFTRYSQMIGTPEYMSPEQAEMSGLDVDTRTDVFSLGVLLYELLTGMTPFDSEYLLRKGYEGLLKTIREEQPTRPSTKLSTLGEALTEIAKHRRTSPEVLCKLVRTDLDWIVMKTLEKDRSRRYESVSEFTADIKRHLNNEPVLAGRPSTLYRVQKFVKRNRVAVALSTLTLLACAAAVFFRVIVNIERLKQREQALIIEQTNERDKRENWARLTAMPEIRQLVEDGHLIRAFRVAKEVERILPDDPAFRELLDSFTATVSFNLQPPGTKVFVRDWDGKADDWMEVGETPLNNVTLPDGGLRFRYVKEGYITREFCRVFPQFLESDGQVTMKEDPGVPEGMVFVDGIQSADWNNLPVGLGDFLIDRYEVSNREYQAFVDGGGYERTQYWDALQFERNGETFSWEEAMAEFRDETGEAGPAGWRHGRFPDGQEDYPVRGVSWYEAAAYAKFAGKRLPTIYHWRWASDGPTSQIVALSNFAGRQPTPRGANLGIGRFDVYDMAGNVKEWCWNQDSQGRRCVRGGAWKEATYQFTLMDVASPWDRSDSQGFRCVRYLDETAPPLKTLAPWERGVTGLTESDRIPLDSLKSWFVYDRNQPLHPQSVEVDDDESTAYRHEIVRIDAAYNFNNERFDIHLFYPNQRQDTYETILFLPGLGGLISKQFTPDAILELKLIPLLVRTGRMVCLPICKGMFERGDGESPDPSRSVQARIQTRDGFVLMSKDIARTLDYLRMRGDVDARRLVYLGYSLSAMLAPPVLANYEGFQAAILVSVGYPTQSDLPNEFMLHPFHFTPYVKLPVLMITGGFDNLFPLDTSQIPFFEDLGSGKKKHIVLESPHGLPPDEIVEAADSWLNDLWGTP